jgi:hypothetical protein
LPASLDTTRLPPSRQDLGHVGLVLFRRLGLNVTASSAATTQSFLRKLLPAAGDRPYLRALLDAYRDRDGNVRPFSEADEARWLAENLSLQALGCAGSGSRLREVWTRACRRARVEPSDATVDRAALYKAIESVALNPLDEDEVVDAIAAAVRSQAAHADRNRWARSLASVATSSVTDGVLRPSRTLATRSRIRSKAWRCSRAQRTTQ